jgi:hypothetical protein
MNGHGTSKEIGIKQQSFARIRRNPSSGGMIHAGFETRF